MNSPNTGFRYRRAKLPPEAFALHPEGPEPPPRDIVEEEVWRGIVFLPDDVSIRTSDDYGTELRAMHELWGSVIEICTEDRDAFFYAVLDVADNLQAALFNALCGFYRVSGSCLRAAVEVAVVGAYLQLEKDTKEAIRWREGKVEVRFGNACDLLIKNSKVKTLEDYLRREMDYSVFQQRQPGKESGWARRLFDELSNFAHARPSHSEGALWEGSNGPVFIPRSFSHVCAHYLDTCCLFFVLAKLCRPKMPAPSTARWLFRSRNILPSKVAVYCFEHLYEKSGS